MACLQPARLRSLNPITKLPAVKNCRRNHEIVCECMKIPESHLHLGGLTRLTYLRTISAWIVFTQHSQDGAPPSSFAPWGRQTWGLPEAVLLPILPPPSWLSKRTLLPHKGNRKVVGGSVKQQRKHSCSMPSTATVRRRPGRWPTRSCKPLRGMCRPW